MEKTNKLTFVDIFAGCGGLSEGFYKQGFQSLAHVEIDPSACKTLVERMKFYGYKNPEKYVINEDITRPDICEIIDKVIDGQIIDVLVGGPPCQAYSTLGRAKDKDNMQNDPRNFLFESYAKILNYYKPKFFIFENVIGLLSAKVKNESIFEKILTVLGKEYNLYNDKNKIILNAVNFGVPQIRKRVIIIGVRKDLNLKAENIYSAIKQTHYAPNQAVVNLKKFISVKEAIGDLPPLHPGERCNKDNLTSHIARKHNEKDISRYILMAKNNWTLEELLEMHPELMHEKKRVFNNSYCVQKFDRPSTTIIAHLHKDGNQFIHPDYKQGRTLTVREAARLQSFPDNFIFMGSRTDQYKQVGNAVPPLLAEVIALAIKKVYNNTCSAQ